MSVYFRIDSADDISLQLSDSDSASQWALHPAEPYASQNLTSDFNNVEERVNSSTVTLITATVTVKCDSNCMETLRENKPVAHTVAFRFLGLSDHMVLASAPKRNHIFGIAPAGSNVSLVMDRSEDIYITQANASGVWHVLLAPLECGGPHSFTAFNGDIAIELLDVLIGDVFLCSGQSNMELPVSHDYDGQKALQAADQMSHIRLLRVPVVAREEPLEEISAAWQVANKHTVKDFSAVCYFFASTLYNNTTNPSPVGLIAAAMGGSPIQPWQSPETVAECKEPDIDPRFLDSDDYRNSRYYNGMIYPLQRLTLTGIVWYQGESNDHQPDRYDCLFPSLIRQWRIRFRDSTLPFVFVQLAAFNQPINPWPPIRASQMRALTVDRTAMASAIDLGDLQYDVPIHPRFKQELGRRVAIAMQYLLTNSTYDTLFSGHGPVPSVSIQSEPARLGVTVPLVAQLSWRAIKNGSELQLLPTRDCTDCCKAGPFEFTVNGHDWKYISIFNISGPSVSLTLPVTETDESVQVRYAWENYPQCLVYDSRMALPVPPFSLTVVRTSRR